MATGREGRAERMAQRLRGAQRTIIDDDSFSLDIAGLSISASPAPVDDPTPSSSAKRRRIDDDGDEDAAAPAEQPSARRRSPRTATKDPYDLPDSSKNSALQSNTDPSLTVPDPAQPDDAGSSAGSRRSVRPNAVNGVEPEDEQDAPETLPALGSVPPTQPRRSRPNVEEIAESPMDAPGSEERRSVSSRDVNPSSAAVSNALYTDDAAPMSSSPLVKKMRRSLRGSNASESVDEQPDELSPNQPRMRSGLNNVVSAQSPGPEPESEPAEAPSTEEMQEEPESEPHRSEEEAEEIGVEEAALKIGRKRPRTSPRRSPRRSPRAKSPELGSSRLEPSIVEEPQEAEEEVEEQAEEEVEEEVQEEVDEPEDEPQPKRRRRTQPPSPAVQKQPTARPRKTQPKSKDKPDARKKAPSKPRRRSDEGDNAAVEITVQRWVNTKKSSNEDAGEGQAEMPFASRSGETVVDVLAQVCDEVAASVLAQLQQALDSAGDAAKKKEYRVKARAVEAYRKELGSRLLEHTTHLDHWHSLRKQLRQAQREKITLREEILRLKAEREQVALQMDEIRIKHEADTKEATHRLNTSSLMNDIDLAVARGREAPELSRNEKKVADLANLELLVARITDEASSASSTGGLLSQVRDFNAFLERAAMALETK